MFLFFFFLAIWNLFQGFLLVDQRKSNESTWNQIKHSHKLTNDFLRQSPIKCFKQLSTMTLNLHNMNNFTCTCTKHTFVYNWTTFNARCTSPHSIFTINRNEHTHISLYIHRTVAKLANTQEVSNTNNAKF